MSWDRSRRVHFVVRLTRLAFLAPQIVESIVEGRQPTTMTAEWSHHRADAGSTPECVLPAAECAYFWPPLMEGKRRRPHFSKTSNRL